MVAVIAGTSLFEGPVLDGATPEPELSVSWLLILFENV